MGSAYGSRHVAGALAASADAGVLACEFRLALEHPFRASLDDALTAYLWLIDQGAAPERVTVVGESSGGGLAVSLLLRLRERGLPLPGGAVLVCPWIDLTCGGALTGAATEPPDDPWPRAASRLMNWYLAGHPPDDPIVNPLAADLTGLPALLVQAATGDRLRDEASRLVDRAAAHGVDATLELYPVDAHVFQLFWSFLPEAADAIRHAGEFARDRAAAATAAGFRTG
jgi:acetyl esterase/lipase